MLPQETIEKIAFDAMKKYSEEHDGVQGWEKEDFQNAVLEAGGDQQDVWRAMALGMNLCGIPCEQVDNHLN